MSLTDDLWALLPAVYRRRDAESGDVLRALVAVLGEQAQLLHDDISGLYDNWFIETCDDWVVPYLGDLTGALPPVPTGEPPDPLEAALLARVAPARRLVANAIRFRRRKGCFTIVAQLARDVAGWPAFAVEYGRLVATNADLRAGVVQGGTARVRDPAALAAGRPVGTLAYGTEVRAAAAARSPGRYAPNNVGLFLFTPTIAPVTHGSAFCVDEEGSTCFHFDPLGVDLQLYDTGLSETGMPAPITRPRLAGRSAIDARLYGPNGCLLVETQGVEGGAFMAVTAERIVPADLAGWRARPPPGFVTLDPARGRLAFPLREAPHRVRVNYAQALPAPLGGGSYRRPRPDNGAAAVIAVAASEPEAHHSLRAAIEAWKKGTEPATVIEFRDSGTYDEDNLLLDFSGATRALTIRSVAGTRPVIRLGNYEAGATDAWRVQGGDGALVLDGLLVAGRGLSLNNYSGSLDIRHCTLFPGWLPQGERARHVPAAPSLAFQNCTGRVGIAASILGPLLLRADEHIDEPLELVLSDVVLDGGESGEALMSPDVVPFARLTVATSTVLGRLMVHEIVLAENSIFTGTVGVARRSAGCVRFSAVPAGSRTPRRFACVPRAGVEHVGGPVFLSRRCGDPGYAVLAQTCPVAIAEGADDRSEMGSHHNLFRPQRLTNLRAALDEYLPAGVSVGVTCVS